MALWLETSSTMTNSIDLDKPDKKLITHCLCGCGAAVGKFKFKEKDCRERYKDRNNVLAIQALQKKW